ncbi:MAG: DUF1643 domain-containing protein [Kangiella sp.]|nr:DUF1643 domain-containing protein [Kangiella sp.]
MSAIFSPCKQYRYLLKRESNSFYVDKTTSLFVMLNPSTADENINDPTIRRCIGFAETWGCAGLIVANLYAYRSTDPKKLNQVSDPIGPENNAHLEKLAKEYDDVVFAWGNNANTARAKQVIEIFQKHGSRAWCLGVTKAGHPKHPLYIRASQPLMPFDPSKLI